MPPMTVLRRSDYTLAPTKVLAANKVGYEINFNRHFCKSTPPRPLEEIMRLLREVTE